MLEIIVAVNEKYGIGLDGKIPWTCKSDLSKFRKITQNGTLIVGRKTCDSLPKLTERKVVCLSGSGDRGTWKNNVVVISSFEDLDKLIENDPHTRYFVSGGTSVYNEYMRRRLPVHISYIKNDTKCDTYFDRKLLDGYVVHVREEYDDFTYMYMTWEGDNSERQYLDIARRILLDGTLRATRNDNVLSVFNGSMVFDLRDGFPLLTTKKMFLKGIVEELLFFLRGDTDTTVLVDRGVNIWKGNTTKEFIGNMNLPYAENVMGPMYGYQWRHFNKPYKISENGTPVKDAGGVDQLNNVVNLIRTDPTSRRIIMTAYNPEQAHEGVLYPCHSITIQFYVDGEYLDMFCYNRSQDFFLGTPYNIASSSLLLMIIAKICNKKPRKFHMSMGDIHIYESHIPVIRQQIDRVPFRKPNIEITRDIDDVKDIHDLVFGDFKISGYISHSKLTAQMIA